MGLRARTDLWRLHAYGRTLASRAEVEDWLAGWLGATRDGWITVQELIDAGRVVVVQRTLGGVGEARPDGQGVAPVSIAVCVALRFDDTGRISRADCYFDPLGIFGGIEADDSAARSGA